MALRFAFFGFRHPHIHEVYRLASKHPDVEIVAACEEHDPTREALNAGGKIHVTHERCKQVFDNVDFDVAALGDYFSNRGPLAIQALKHNKHVIADKPLCTNAAELEEIEHLASQNGRVVGCQLGMRYSGKFARLKELVVTGKLGDLHQIAIGGQHPLSYGSRADWYFEPGKHGGTINDIGIHAFSLLEWMTAQPVTSIVAARTWNAFASDVPHFMDSAQFMLTLKNGCGVLGDMSYALPSELGFQPPQYWRTTIFGSQGIAETNIAMDHVTFATHKDKQITKLPPLNTEGDGYFPSFLNEIAGESEQVTLPTREVIACTRLALRVQAAADKQERDVAI